MTLAGCASAPPVRVGPSTPYPTESATTQRARNLEIQQQVLSLIPSSAIDTSTSKLPKIGENKRSLSPCVPYSGPQPSDSTAEPVHYSDTFTIVLTPGPAGENARAELDNKLGESYGWERVIYTHEHAPDFKEWRTQDEFVILISVTVTDQNQSTLLAVNVTSPCFIPEPPYGLGDKL